MLCIYLCRRSYTQGMVACGSSRFDVVSIETVANFRASNVLPLHGLSTGIYNMVLGMSVHKFWGNKCYVNRRE